MPTKKIETSKKSKSQPVKGGTIAKKTASRKVVTKKTTSKKVAKEVQTEETPVKTARQQAAEQSDLVKKYRSTAKDTGSIAVQVALLTDRIDALAKHLGKHAHDFDSKRGLLILVGKRRRLLNYLRKNDEKAYTKLVKDLKLKK